MSIDKVFILGVYRQCNRKCGVLLEGYDNVNMTQRLVSRTQARIKLRANEWTVDWRRERIGNGSKAPKRKTEQ
jgi:hypothetical protein